MSNMLPAPHAGDSAVPAGADTGVAAWEPPGYPGAGIPAAPAGQANQFQRYLSALARHKWWVIAITLVGTVGGTFASRMVKPQYQAQSTLWIEIGSNGQGDSGPIRTDELLQSTGWIELLKSYMVLDHVVKEQRLYLKTADGDRAVFGNFQLQPRFRPGKYRLKVGPSGRDYTLYNREGLVAQGDGIPVETGAVGHPVGKKVGFQWTPAPSRLPPNKVLTFTVMNPRDEALNLASLIRTRMQDKNANFLGLTLEGTDPAQTTATLNALADRYVQVAAQLKRARLDELTTVLDEQRRYAEENLRSAEIDLERFRVQTVTLPSEHSTPVAPGLEITRDPVMSRFFDMKVEREQLRTDREGIERVLSEAARSNLPLDALTMIPTIAGSPALKQALEERTQKRAELRALQQRYTSEYRPVQQLAAQLQDLEKVTIPSLALDMRAQLMDREEELERRVSAASSELRQIPPRAIEEARLQRRVATAENLHGMLKQRFEEARLAAASTIPDIRILDPAVVPHEPVEDPRAMLLLLGFVSSLGLSVAGVIVLDRFDPRVRYPEQVSAGLGLPILGVIPNVAGSTPDKDVSRHAAEAIRELRLNLIHAHGAAGPLLFTITSPESGDGKSFVTSNLAISFAEQGFRTLVIDGDIRRGALHRVLGGVRAPGLTDYLAGSAAEAEIVQETSFGGVTFIASGTRKQNGPELLSSQAMAQLVLRLRSRFDVILVDSPPLGAGVDAYALGTLTRDLVVVVRTGTTNRGFAEAKLNLVDRLPIRILGAVLNGTPDTKMYRYYSYLPGYEASEESAEEVASIGGGRSD